MRRNRIQLSLYGLFVFVAIAGLIFLATRRILSMPREDVLWMIASFVAGIMLGIVAIMAAQWSSYTKLGAVAMVAMGAFACQSSLGSYALGLLSCVIGWWWGLSIINELLALCGVVESRRVE